MMDDVNLNEPQDQHHSLPEPERRTIYSEAEKKRKPKTLIWSIAGVAIVVVVIVFSLAFVNSTGGRGSSSSSTASASNARDPVFDDDALPDGDGGGLDFDYGEGDGDIAAVVDPYNDESYSASYSSADDGGSYNVKSDDLTGAPTADDATYEPAYEPTTEPTIGEAHLGIPTYEPTMAGTIDDTPDASAEVSEETSGPFDYDALDAAFSMSMSSSYDQEDEPMSGQVKEANADDNGGAGGSLQQSGSYSDFSSSYYGSGSAALGARQRRRRLYRNRRRVMRTGAAKR